MRKYNLLNTEAGVRAEEERLARQRDRKKKRRVIEIDDESFFSNRKNIIRLVLFALAAGLAIFFMVRAVNTLIHKDPGWYEIECDVDKDVPYYSSDVTFKYEFTGSSTEIGKLMKEIKNSYSSSLKRYYMLFNAAEEYEDVVNVATVNSSRGEWVTLDGTVYRSLKDASERTCDAYSVTRGIFNAIRDPIIYSESPLEADPEFDSVSAEMLSELDGIMKKDGAAKVEFDDAKSAVRLTVSDELEKFMEKWELDCPVLDLGQLREAYLLDAVSKDLEKDGYTKGYLTTDSGLSVLLSGFGVTDLAMYSTVDSEEGEITVVSATFRAEGGDASAAYRAFRRYDGEYGFYSFEKDGRTYYRDPYMSDFDGEEKAFSVLAVSDKGDVVSAAYEALRCLRSGTCEVEDDVTVLVETIDDRGVIRSTSSDVTYNSGAGFTLE